MIFARWRIHKMTCKHCSLFIGAAYFLFMYAFHSNLQVDIQHGSDSEVNYGIVGEEAIDKTKRKNVRDLDHGGNDDDLNKIFESYRKQDLDMLNASNGSQHIDENTNRTILNINTNNKSARRTQLLTAADIVIKTLELVKPTLSESSNIHPRCLSYSSKHSTNSPAVQSSARSSVSGRANEEAANDLHPGPPRYVSSGATGISESDEDQRLPQLKKRYVNAKLPFARPLDVFIEDDFKFQEIAPKSLVFSAFVDDRPNDFDNRHNGSYVRIMTILGVKDDRRPYYCAFDSEENSDKRTLLVSRVSQIYEMCENHGTRLGGFILSCSIPMELQSHPCFVTLYPEDPSEPDFDITMVRGVRIPIRTISHRYSNHGIPSTEVPRNFTVCVPPLFGDINPSRLIEFIEFTIAAGFERIVFYPLRIKSEVLEILKYYALERKVIDIVPWNLPSDYEKNIWYHGQLIAIQDCLYRNMALSSYVAFTDMDELLVPRTHDSWWSQIQNLDTQNRCGYQFLGAYFKPFASLKEQQQNSTLSSLVIFNSFERTAKLDRIRTKCIVKPRFIFEKGIHHISKPIWSHFEAFQVDPKDASLHHYKPCKVNSFFRHCNEIVTDESALKFSSEAVRWIIHTRRQLPFVE